MSWPSFLAFASCMLTGGYVAGRVGRRRKLDPQATWNGWESFVAVAAFLGVCLLAMFRT